MKLFHRDNRPAVSPTGEMTLFEHLAELRMRIIRAGLAVMLGNEAALGLLRHQPGQEVPRLGGLLGVLGDADPVAAAAVPVARGVPGRHQQVVHRRPWGQSGVATAYCQGEVDGRSRELDFRVSTLPTLFGEKVVLRLLDIAQS